MVEEKALVITELIERAEPVANFLAAATGRREYSFLWPDMAVIKQILGRYSRIYVDMNLKNDFIREVIFCAKNQDQNKEVYILKIQIVPKEEAKISPGTIIPIKFSPN